MTNLLTTSEAARLAGIVLATYNPALLLTTVILALVDADKRQDLILGLLEGDTIKTKVLWAMQKARPAFDSEARLLDLANELVVKIKEPSEPGDITFHFRAAMVTPMLVYKDTGLVKRQATALKAAGYTAIASLVDLQTGQGQRDYIVAGRMATKLTDEAEQNLEAVIAAGLTPVVIIRNDWAVRTKTGHIPSISGQPETETDFYSSTRLRYEKQFLDSLAVFYPDIYIQLSIEPNAPESADFALQLARHLRARGFAGRLFVNPIGAAVTAHEAIRGELAAVGVEWARSHHGSMLPPDPVWNTDGDTALNGNGVRERVRLMESSGKDWILWTQTLANCPGNFPAEYLNVGLLADSSAPTGLTGKEPGFLWKPKGEHTNNLVVLLPAAFTGKSKTDSGALWHGGKRLEAATYTGTGNGGRDHYRFGQPGGSYPSRVEFRIDDSANRSWAWEIASPAKRHENLHAEAVS